MIKAVIFDCFGVLVTDSWSSFKHKYFKNNQKKTLEASRLMDLATEGTLKNADFLAKVGKIAGITAEETRKELSGNTPNLRLFEFIDELKPKLKIGMLSNASDNWLDTLFSQEQLSKFEEVVLSCEIMANKPEPKTYQTIASKLGVELDECVFIDDVQRYVDGAEEMGMHAIHYKNLEQTITEIRDLVSDVNN